MTFCHAFGSPAAILESESSKEEEEEEEKEEEEDVEEAAMVQVSLTGSFSVLFHPAHVTPRW